MMSPDMQILRSDNSTFLDANSCFENVQKGTPNFDNIYCVGNIMIAFLSFINALLFTYLLVVHLK